MFFIARSIFWLTMAFVVIAPQVDIKQNALDTSWRAFGAGQAAVSDYVPKYMPGYGPKADCADIACRGTRAIALGRSLAHGEKPAVLANPGASASVAEGPVAPSPVPRPAWAS